MIYFCCVPKLYASAFSVKDQSAVYLGYAYAGTAALATDASTGFFNPAGLTNVGDQLVTSFVGIKAKTKLEATLAKDNGGSDVNSSSITYPKGRGLIPALHFSKLVNPNLSLAFNVTSPFSLKLSYNGDSIAQYMSTKSSIRSINFSSSLGYRLNDNLAIGFGVDLLRAHVILNSNCKINSQGYLNHDGIGWSYGYHLGLLYYITANTRVGLAYNSRYAVSIKGATDALNINPPLPTDFRLSLKLPDRIVYSVYHSYDNRWSILSDIEWMHWSLFKRLRYEYNTNTHTEESQNFHNSFRLALGISYKVNESFALKSGVSFEQSPVKAEDRNARIPDSDRVWLAVGFQYNLLTYLVVDFGYTHIFFKNAVIDADSPDDQLKGTLFSQQQLIGRYRTHADILGLQLKMEF